VCPNAQVVPLEKVDLAVLMAVRVTALAREVVSRTLDEVFRGFEPPNLDAELATLHQQRAVVEQSIANLTSAIEASGGIDSLIAKLRARHQEREALIVRIATVEGNKAARSANRCNVVLVSTPTCSHRAQPPNSAAFPRVGLVADKGLTPVEQQIARALARALVRELREPRVEEKAS
jgi:hypothetical protein